MAQVTGNLESQRRQYDLAKAAEAAGFASVTVIDDDLGRSGSGMMLRPGFVGSVKRLVLNGILPATQVMPGSPWLVPVEALTSEVVRIGVQGVIDRRPQFYEQYQCEKLIRLPGI